MHAHFHYASVCVCKMLGGVAAPNETNYWQSLGNSYPITGALSLTALWENQPPTPATEKKNILSSIVNKLAHMCVFAVNESTATRKIPSPSVCKGVSAWRTDRLHKEVGEEV